MNEIVVVERVFEEPASIEELQAREDAVAWCLEQHRVTALRSYFSIDRRTMVCIYRAPDAEAVRETQRQGGLPFRRIWAAEVLREAEPGVPAPPRSTVVVEREFPQPLTMAQVIEIFEREGGCLDLHRAALLSSFLSRDGRSMCCVFAAPDAESVRIANRQMGIPVKRAWPSTVHVAPAGPRRRFNAPRT